MAYELPVDLAQIRFASQKKGGGRRGGGGGERSSEQNWYFSPVELEYMDEWNYSVFFESIYILC